MEIIPNSNIGATGRMEASQPKKVESQAVKEAKANFSDSEALKQALRESSDVRADVVAKGRQLVMDSSYPSTETIKKIATLLAKNIAS